MFQAADYITSMQAHQVNTVIIILDHDSSQIPRKPSKEK